MVKSLAYFLPQFHSDEKNNKWWGDGFTEWSHFKEVKNYYPWQKIRSPLGGYYFLDDEVVLANQYSNAKEIGLDGFIVWNYWFGNGVKALDRPLEIILDKNIDFKFCLAWANHSWFNKSKNILLQEQLYLGESDYKDYFEYCLRFFKTSNYIKIDNKPIFFIFKPLDIPDLKNFLSLFDKLAKENGFNGLFFVAENTNEIIEGFDRFVSSGKILNLAKYVHPIEKAKQYLRDRGFLNLKNPIVYDYKKLSKLSFNLSLKKNELPSILTGWDTSIRHKSRGVILKNFDEKIFKMALVDARKKMAKNDFLVVKSWNEWAEGNILENDSVFGSSLGAIFKEQMGEIIKAD